MSYNMTNVLGILFASTHEALVSELTANRSMAAVPFGGSFRMVDFPLSAMSNSGMSKVGIITKSNYQSLMDHVGSARPWDLARTDGGLTLLNPFGRTADSSLFKGKLDALYSCLGYIKKTGCEYAVLSDCALAINPDFSKLVEKHVANGADITVLCKTCEYTEEETREATCFDLDENGRVTAVAINRAGSGLRTMDLNIYVIKVSLLVELVEDLVSLGKFSFSRDVLQAKCSELDIRAYDFEGYYRRICDTESYYNANMSLLDDGNLSKLNLKSRPIYTKDRSDAPARYGFDSAVKNSLIANGCVIDGIVENSILFRGVKVEKGAVIRNSILMQDTVVGKGTTVSNIITDKNVVIGDGLTVSSVESCPLYIAKGRKL